MTVGHVLNTIVIIANFLILTANIVLKLNLLLSFD